MGSPTLLFCKDMENNGTIIEKIRRLAAEAAENEGLELVDVALSGSGRRALLRVTVDKEDGVTIADCERTSRGLEALLDVEDPIRSAYVLEVSSPGMDRPLVKQADFAKSVGKQARIVTSENIAGVTFFIGRITDVGDGWIRLKIEKKEKTKKGVPERLSEESEDLFIPLDKISKARLEIEIK